MCSRSSLRGRRSGTASASPRGGEDPTRTRPDCCRGFSPTPMVWWRTTSTGAARGGTGSPVSPSPRASRSTRRSRARSGTTPWPTPPAWAGGASPSSATRPTCSRPMAEAAVETRPLEARMRLEGRNALIIGGSGEIGGVIAHTLAALGADVGLAARNVERCAALAEDIESRHGVRTAAIQADAGTREGVAATVEAFRTAVGPLDVLVFNAGAYAAGEVWEIPPERWRKVFALNVDGPFFAVQEAFEDLRDRGGNVIIVSSVGGMLSFPRNVSKVVPYTTSKAAVMHL